MERIPDVMKRNLKCAQKRRTFLFSPWWKMERKRLKTEWRIPLLVSLISVLHSCPGRHMREKPHHSQACLGEVSHWYVHIQHGWTSNSRHHVEMAILKKMLLVPHSLCLVFKGNWKFVPSLVERFRGSERACTDQRSQTYGIYVEHGDPWPICNMKPEEIYCKW